MIKQTYFRLRLIIGTVFNGSIHVEIEIYPHFIQLLVIVIHSEVISICLVLNQVLIQDRGQRYSSSKQIE